MNSVFVLWCELWLLFNSVAMWRSFWWRGATSRWWICGCWKNRSVNREYSYCHAYAVILRQATCRHTSTAIETVWTCHAEHFTYRRCTTGIFKEWTNYLSNFLRLDLLAFFLFILPRGSLVCCCCQFPPLSSLPLSIPSGDTPDKHLLLQVNPLSK